MPYASGAGHFFLHERDPARPEPFLCARLRRVKFQDPPQFIYGYLFFEIIPNPVILAAILQCAVEYFLLNI